MVRTPTGMINGFTDGKFKIEKGKVVLIFGPFYQLPSSDPMFGAIEFIRKTDAKDSYW
jgi:hypothetical protein